MRIGLSLPTFGRDARLPLDVAAQAELAGLDGVFVFDHLFPIGRPDRPALSAFPVLGAVAASTSRIVVGSLVARVGLLDPDRVVDALSTLVAIVGGTDRLIAGLGAGDHLSAAEAMSYGLGFPPAADRVASLASVAERLSAGGVTTWAGGRSALVRSVAARHASALNVWGASVDEVAAEGADLQARAAGRAVGLTWGGQVLVGSDPDDLAQRRARFGDRPGLVSGTVGEVAAHLTTLAEVGALSWAVCAPLDAGEEPEAAVANLAEVRRTLALA